MRMTHLLGSAAAFAGLLAGTAAVAAVDKRPLREIRQLATTKRIVEQTVVAPRTATKSFGLAAFKPFAQPRVGTVPGFLVNQQFQGVGLVDTIPLGTGAIPPDHAGASNGQYVVQGVNGAVAIFTTSGRLLRLVTDYEFYRRAGISAALLDVGLSDPRITWDQATQRWFVVWINVDFNGNSILLAVSKTANPLDGFRAVPVLVKPGVLGDFPTLGVNADAVTMSTNNFGLFGFQDVSIISVPKIDLVGAGRPSLARISRFAGVDAGDYGFAVQPVNSADPSDGTQGLLAISAVAFNEFNYSQIISAGQYPAGLTPPTIVFSKFDGNPISGRQPGGTTYDNGDDRLSASIQQVGDFIYFTNAVGNNPSQGQSGGGKGGFGGDVASPIGHAGAVTAADAPPPPPNSTYVHWAILNRKTRKIVAEGRIIDPSRKTDYSYPAIAANGNGRFVVAYNGSSATTNISAYATICEFDKTTNKASCTAPKLLKYGLDDNYDLSGGAGGRNNRWGDYNAVQADPADPAAFWLFQEVPGAKQLRANGTYGSRWATVITRLVTQ